MTHQLTGDDVVVVCDHDSESEFIYTARFFGYLDGEFSGRGRTPFEAVCRLASQVKRAWDEI